MENKLKKLLITILALAAISQRANAGDLAQQFKNPAFNGYGWSAHVMAIDSQERSRKQAIVDSANAKIAQAKAEANNTPLARFMALFSSQVYSQLATQLSNNLFAETGNSGVGTFKLDGNTVSYVKTSSNVTLTVVDIAGASTVITVPIAQFYF
jgi:hypothetical protein